MHTFGWRTIVVALTLGTAAMAAAQTRGSIQVQGDAAAAPPECAGLAGVELADCMRAYDALNAGSGASVNYGGNTGAYGGRSASSVTTTPSASDTSTGTAPSTTGTSISTPRSATRLNIDTRNTGVDLGLTRNAQGAVVPKVTAGTTARTPALSNTNPAMTDMTAGGTAGANANAGNANGIGGANDASAYAKPGTSTFGNPTSSGRDNGNSGTNDGRSTPGVSGGTGLVNSGTSGNGLGSASSSGAASGNTGAGPAASGNTGAGNAASGTTGAAGASSTDAATASQAAQSSRTMSGNSVSGRILGGRNPGGTNGPALGSGTSGH